MKRDERLARLSREHTQALMLALRIRREAPQADADALGMLFSQMVVFWTAGLLPHFTAESECLLVRLVRHVPANSNEVRRLQDDHLHVETLIAAMRDTDDNEQRRTLLLELGETLRIHVRWEEETLFPLAEALLLRPNSMRLAVTLRHVYRSIRCRGTARIQPDKRTRSARAPLVESSCRG